MKALRWFVAEVLATSAEVQFRAGEWLFAAAAAVAPDGDAPAWVRSFRVQFPYDCD